MLHALILSLALAGCKSPPATEQNAAANVVAAPAAVQPSAVAGYDFPALAGRVVDEADLLSPEKEAQLTSLLAGLEARTRHQFAIATVKSLGGHSIDDYGTALANHWRLGRKGINDGVLLTVAPNERKVRIDVADGLRGLLTDPESARIIADTIIPSFMTGDFPTGIEQGAKAVIAEIDADKEQGTE